MKDNNNIEFDQLFRQQLENASAPVPGGVWEGISSSIGSSAGVATAAVKTALWVKTAIAVSVIGVVAAVTYQVTADREAEQVNLPKTELMPVPADIQNQDQPVPDHTVTPQEETKPSVSIPVKKSIPTRRVKNDKYQQHAELRLDPQQPDIRYYESKPEISVDYLAKMNEQVVPGFDSSKVEKRDSEVREDEPYIPEKEAVALVVDSSYIYIPNVVTPNGDGINDGYLIDIRGEEYVQIIIYTSKSVKVFETRNKHVAWNCTLPNGETAPEGTYIVRVIYKFKNKPKSTTATNLRLIK